MKCMECQMKIDSYDIGCYRKLINRGAETFLCRNCLAKKFGWERERIDVLIERFIQEGCTLFPKRN